MLRYIVGFMLGAIIFSCPHHAHARDNGQWADTSPQVRKWFSELMQPDAPMISCCGEADAYEADEYTVDGDTIVAVITDERGDTFPNGTKIRVPPGKVKWDGGNPTGHGIIFLSGAGAVYCYVAPGGV